MINLKLYFDFQVEGIMEEEGDFASRVQKAFGHTDLYSILGVEKTATLAVLKKGYYKSCLAFHPGFLLPSHGGCV